MLDVLNTTISAQTPLMVAGIDSLGATELQRALSTKLSDEFPATLLFDHPSIGEILSFVLGGHASVGLA